MGYFGNLGNEREVLAALEEQAIKNTSTQFEESLASVRKIIGEFSSYLLDRSVSCFDSKTSTKRKECGLYYLLFNISINSTEVDPVLVNLFFYICSALSREQRPSLIIELPVDFSSAWICRLKCSKEGDSFNSMGKRGLLAENKKCPFQNLINRESYTFWDIINNCFSQNPWPDWENAPITKI